MIHSSINPSVAIGIAKDILEIMETYHEQELSAYGVDTPGGLEHMGDVWRLFREWEKRLNAD